MVATKSQESQVLYDTSCCAIPTLQDLEWGLHHDPLHLASGQWEALVTDCSSLSIAISLLDLSLTA